MMTCRIPLTCTASRLGLAAALLAAPAAADVTGPQVWADWQDYFRGLGHEISGSESQSGDTLTITDMDMTLAMPDEEGTMAMTLPRVTFTDNPDGTVTVGLPDDMPLTFDLTPENGEAAKGTVTFAQTVPAMIVSGEETDMTYTYSAEAMDIVLDSLEVDGEVMTPDDLSLTARITEPASVTRMQIGDMRSYAQDLTAAGLTYDVAFVVPEDEGGGSGRVSGRMDGITSEAAGDLPLDGDSSNMDAMLEAGMTVAGSFSYTGGSMQIDMQPPEGPLVGSTASDGGTIDVSMGPDGLSYDVTQTNLSVDMEQVPDVPFPVSMQMAESAFNLTMPVRATEDAQDFAFGFTLGDFTITDTIWNLFDPAGQLPRDPATVTLDLTGKARLLADMMDPDQAEALMGSEPPGELEALNINALRVSALGALVTGEGAFTFDNSDTETFNGMPRPEGAVDIRVEGANALIDTLVQMGLLPEEQAMGARMMMGMFGVPDGEDTLTSRIEVNDQGHVMANGQRLQ